MDGWRQRSVADRACWLAELAEALEIARKLHAQLAATGSANRETLALAEHLANAIAEVQALRRGGIWQFGGNLGPQRIEHSHDRANSAL